jgi:hypothetical protein
VIAAYDEAWIRAAFARIGFAILKPVHYRSWCERPARPVSLQDLIVAERAGA